MIWIISSVLLVLLAFTLRKPISRKSSYKKAEFLTSAEKELLNSDSTTWWPNRATSWIRKFLKDVWRNEVEPRKGQLLLKTTLWIALVGYTIFKLVFWDIKQHQFNPLPLTAPQAISAHGPIISGARPEHTTSPKGQAYWDEIAHKAMAQVQEESSEWKTIRLSGMLKPDAELRNVQKCIGLEGYAFAIGTTTLAGADLSITGQSTTERASLDLSLPKVHVGDSISNIPVFRLMGISPGSKKMELDTTALRVGHYYIVKTDAGHAILRVLALDVKRGSTPISKDTCEGKFRYIYSSGDIKTLGDKLWEPKNLHDPL